MWRLMGLCFIFVTSSSSAGLFGPSDYDECVLDGLKNAKSKDLAPAIYNACANKFPTKPSRQDREDAAKSAAILKKCRITEEQNRSRMVIGGDSRVGASAYIANLKSITLDASSKYSNSISFQNNNKIGISAVQIGFGLDKRRNNSCSFASEDYKAVLNCFNLSTDNGVGAGSYGSLECDPNVRNFRNESYCIIGFAPVYDRFIKGFAVTLDEMGLCN